MATNTVNGKKYIGFDSAWPNRQKDHLKKAFGKYNQSNKCYFHRAIQKHGRDSFEWNVLYQSLDGEHTKNVMENHFIVEYRTFRGFDDCNGYNLSLGGDGNLGRIHSAEAIEKMIRNKTGKLTTRSKPITTPYGSFDSLAAATLVTSQHGISKDTVYKRVISPYFPEWFYIDQPKEMKDRVNINKYSRQISTPRGVYSSITEAANELQLLTQTIRYRLNSNTYPEWSFIDPKLERPPRAPCVTPRPKRGAKFNSKQVSTPFGIFSCLSEAADQLGEQAGTIRCRLLNTKYPEWHFIV